MVCLRLRQSAVNREHCSYAHRSTESMNHIFTMQFQFLWLLFSKLVLASYSNNLKHIERQASLCCLWCTGKVRNKSQHNTHLCFLRSSYDRRSSSSCFLSNAFSSTSSFFSLPLRSSLKIGFCVVDRSSLSSAIVGPVSKHHGNVDNKRESCQYWYATCTEHLRFSSVITIAAVSLPLSQILPIINCLLGYPPDWLHGFLTARRDFSSCKHRPTDKLW